MKVRTVITRKGIASAKNLHSTLLFISGMGSKDTQTAQPTKKRIDFKDTISSFFHNVTSSFLFDIRYLIDCTPEKS